MKHTFLIPKSERLALLKRLLIVWGVALVIAFLQWVASGYAPERLSVYLVYSYAISSSIWFFNDPCRYFFRGQQAKNWYSLPFLVVGCLLGYGLGTWIGDAYAGWSTWNLWALAPAKFAGLLGGSVLISAAFVAYFIQRSKAERMARETTEAQLRLLQSQLEPHMLFNTLANLRALVGQDDAQAQAMLDRLIDFLRTTLQASRQSHHSLQQEFACLNDYLSLMQMRMGQRLKFKLNLPTELAQHPIPTLILQPLVENSIRHGLEPQIEGGTVEVNAAWQGQRLCLSVQDDGLGFQEHAPTLGTSFGLSHVRQRLHTLYGKQAQLHMTNLPAGACVTLLLPAHEDTP